MEDVVTRAAHMVPSPRQLAWQRLETIAFAHFGVNTFTDREWGVGSEDPNVFYPTAFDPHQWAQALKDAGMKMLILTAKHHDGFCLWPSKYTDHCVRSSRWQDGKGDVVRDAAQACRQAGLKFGVYLSPWDRHEPKYGDSPAYNEHYINQLRELLTGYGEISEVWFDGAIGEGADGKKKNQVYDWESYYRVIRELQPDAVIAISGPDVRWVGNESGFARETEWSVLQVDGSLNYTDMGDIGARERLGDGNRLRWYPAETDVSIRPGWFYHAHESPKTVEQLLEIYYRSVGRNSVLLLNFPPDQRGRIPDADAANAQEMRRILDATFARDLARGKPAAATASHRSGDHGPGAAVDGRSDTYWTTDEGVTAAALEVDLRALVTFDVAGLQEAIPVGQRIEEFVLEAPDGAGWKEVARGTTIGYKRILRFPSVTTSKVRLRILRSRVCPTLAHLGLYKHA